MAPSAGEMRSLPGPVLDRPIRRRPEGKAPPRNPALPTGGVPRVMGHMGNSVCAVCQNSVRVLRQWIRKGRGRSLRALEAENPSLCLWALAVPPTPLLSACILRVPSSYSSHLRPEAQLLGSQPRVGTAASTPGPSLAARPPHSARCPLLPSAPSPGSSRGSCFSCLWVIRSPSFPH